MSELQYNQAVTLLQQRAEAADDLVTFSRIIDIPAVPIEGSDDQWTVVETPLADHHLLTLHALQAMTKGQLLYNPDTLQPLTLPTPAGLEWRGDLVGRPANTAPVGLSGGGVGVLKGSAPSLNAAKEGVPQPPAVSPSEGNQSLTHPEDQESVVKYADIQGGSRSELCQTSGQEWKTESEDGGERDTLSTAEAISQRHNLDSTELKGDSGELSPSQRKSSITESTGDLSGDLPLTDTGENVLRADQERNSRSTTSSQNPHIQKSVSTLTTCNPSVGSATGEKEHISSITDSVIIEGTINPRLLRDKRYSTCRRVMIMMPPGSAKSTYASVVFPVWEMGRSMDTEVILTGWGDPICRRHGKRARKICNTELYKEIFASQLDPNTRAAEDWALMNGSTYKSSGINSGVAGFRAGGLVWDDLTKNRKEADSQTIRDDVWNAYIDDARSRKKPDAWEVGIGTRWHEDEIMGRILPAGYSGASGYMECRDGNVWLVICLAAECEREDDPLGRMKGEMIWPEWFGEDYWAEKRMNPRSWGSLYQQRPAPEEGIMFKREDFKYYDVLPDGLNYICIDPAVSEEDDADDTAILVFRVDEFARMYLISRHIMHVTMDKWVAFLLEKAQFYKPQEVVGESGVIRRAAEPWLKRAQMKLRAWFTFEWVNRHANKPAMARGAQAMVSAGQVFVPRNSDGEDFVDSCMRFPASKEDHDVDAFVNLCLRLEFIWETKQIKTVVEESPIIGSNGISIKSLMPPRFPKRKSRWKKMHRTT